MAPSYFSSKKDNMMQPSLSFFFVLLVGGLPSAHLQLRWLLATVNILFTQIRTKWSHEPSIYDVNVWFIAELITSLGVNWTFLTISFSHSLATDVQRPLTVGRSSPAPSSGAIWLVNGANRGLQYSTIAARNAWIVLTFFGDSAAAAVGFAAMQRSSRVVRRMLTVWRSSRTWLA